MWVDIQENVQEHTWTTIRLYVYNVAPFDDMSATCQHVHENSMANCKVFPDFPCTVWYHIYFPYSQSYWLQNYRLLVIGKVGAQGGGRSFNNRKPIGEVGCCESGMAERSHWWTERCLISLTLSLFCSLSLSLSLTFNLPTYRSIYVSIYRSTCLSICLSIYLSIYLFI